VARGVGGAAALACLGLLRKMGLRKDNIVVTDIIGVVYKGRIEEMDPLKEQYAVDTAARTLAEVIDGADVFLGLSAGGVLKVEMVSRMAARPLILALANPEPEILPHLARQAKPDAVIATGRSDFPNQVNNVLCFPFIFRGALDVGATTIADRWNCRCGRSPNGAGRAVRPCVVRAGGSWARHVPAIRPRLIGGSRGRRRRW
jgi:malate dehydrogenase (oxaloacetate-decarboxylating)(NADP+)